MTKSAVKLLEGPGSGVASGTCNASFLPIDSVCRKSSMYVCTCFRSPALSVCMITLTATPLRSGFIRTEVVGGEVCNSELH